MKSFKYALRSLFRKQRQQLVKILFLGLGLAIGLLLVAKVWYKNTYDNFYPDTREVYNVQWRIQQDDFQFDKITIPGGIGPVMKMVFPEVVSATRFTMLDFAPMVFRGEDKKALKSTVALADDELFDLLPRRIIDGDPAREVLSRPMYAFVSSTIAERMSGDVIGQTIELERYPGKMITIGGVFEAVPENSFINPYDVLISLCSISNFMGDGSMGLEGNDRYVSMVRLLPGTDPARIEEMISKYIEQYLQEQEDELGEQEKYILVPLDKVYSSRPHVKRMSVILGFLAVTLLITVLLNYLLVVLSGIVTRAKDFAVMKCQGAGAFSVASLIYAEAVIQIGLLLLTGGFIVLLFRGTAEELLGISLASLLSVHTLAVVSGVVALLVFIAGFIPSRMIMGVPVSTIFRNYKSAGRVWKMALLFFQFAAAAFLVVLQTMVIRQYNAMLSDEKGYTFENVVYVSLAGTSQAGKRAVENELLSLPFVDVVSYASYLPFQGLGGNMVINPHENTYLFNFADVGLADGNFTQIFDIRVTEGVPFSEGVSVTSDFLISKSFAGLLNEHLGWENVVGRDLRVSQYGSGRITGVYEDFKLGYVGSEDTRPSLIVYWESKPNILLVRLADVSPENIQGVRDVLNTLFPERDDDIISYKDKMIDVYNASRVFRNSIILGTLIILLIVIIGIVGYVNNEVQRRASEIAIRKVNGASAGDIMRLLARDIAIVSIAALLPGCAAAFYVAGKWMEEFSEKAAQPAWLIGLVLICVLLLAVAVVVLSSYRTASRNPVDSLRKE